MIWAFSKLTKTQLKSLSSKGKTTTYKFVRKSCYSSDSCCDISYNIAGSRRHPYEHPYMKYSSILLLSLSLASGFASAGDSLSAGVGGALGGVLGSAVGQQLGGNTGSAIGAGLGGAAGGAVGANRHNRTEAAIGGGLGAAGGNVLGRSVGGSTGSLVGAAAGGGGGAALGNYMATENRRDDDRRSYRGDRRDYKHGRGHRGRYDHGRHRGWDHR
jgi:hypothetical protein